MLRELFDETIDIGALEAEHLDELGVRRLLIRAAQLERDLEKTKTLKQAVTEEYDRQLEALAEQLRWIRGSVQAWVERNGKASFPDVGTAYLAHQEPKIEIVDKDAFKAAVGAMFVKEVFDETGAKGYALERALELGEILPGVQIVPGGPGLRIRKT